MSDYVSPWALAVRLLCPWDYPGKNTRVGCHFLLQGIFPIQGSNPGLPHCTQTLPFELPGKPKGECIWKQDLWELFHKDGVPMNEIAVVNKIPQSSLILSTLQWYTKFVICKGALTWPCLQSNLRLLISRTLRNNSTVYNELLLLFNSGEQCYL